MTIYVDTDYAGGDGDGTESKPWTTIQLALDNQTAGETDTIKVAEGTYTETAANYLLFDATNNASVITIEPWVEGETVTINTSGAYVVYVYGMTSGSITFDNIKLRSSSTPVALIRNRYDVSMSFLNCDIGNDADNTVNAMLCSAKTGATRDVSITDCTFANVKNIGSFQDVGDLIISECDVEIPNHNSAVHGIQLTGVFDTISITNNVIDSRNTFNGYSVLYTDGSTPPDGDMIHIDRNTIYSANSAVKFTGASDRETKFLIENNTIEINSEATAGYGINLGSESSDADPLGPSYILNNTIEYTGADTGHAILMGLNTQAGIIDNNICKNGNYQIVIKGDNITCQNNLCCGPKGITLKGADGCNVKNNTVYSTGGWALSWGVQGVDDSVSNYIVNNIFDGSNADYCIANDSNGNGLTGLNGNILDHNCYVSGGTAFAHVDGETDPISLAEWVTLISSWGDTYLSSNDTDSIEANPSFVDAGSYDFTPQNENLLLSDNTWIGKVTPATDYPAVENVLSTDTVNGEAGRLTLPGEEYVLNDVDYGVGGDGSTGNYVPVSDTHVLLGVEFGPASVGVGSLILPDADDVLVDIEYGVEGDLTIGTLSPPDAPTISGIVDDGTESSVTVTVTGTGTIKLYYRVRNSTDWTAGESRSGAGTIQQTGLSSGWYEFYATADDGVESGPSEIHAVKVLDSSTSVSPVGEMATAMDNLRSLLAESATFQDEINATGTSAEKIATAKESIHLVSISADEDAGFTHPFMLICNSGTNNADAIGTGSSIEYQTDGDLELRIEKEIPTAWLESDSNAELDFLNFIEAIRTEALALSGQAGYFVINTWQIIDGPCRYESVSSQADIYMIRIRINWGLS